MKAPLIRLKNEDVSVARRYGISPWVLGLFKGNTEKIALALSLAENKQKFKVYSRTVNELPLLFRPIDFTILSADNNVVNVVLRAKTCKVLARIQYNSPEDLLNKLNSWMYVIGVYNPEKNVVYSKKLSVIEITSDIESAKHYYEKFKDRYGHLGLSMLWMYSFGIKPTRILFSDDQKAKALWVAFLVRLLPLISPIPIHVFEISSVATGKTTTAMIYKSIFGWDYFNEPPSLATLIGDARTGISRIQSVNGIWFDEFEKWFAKLSGLTTLNEIIETLLTGMEQGVWKRSKGGIHTIETNKYIPIIMSGNIPLERSNPREYLKKLVQRASKTAGEPFSDRVSIAVGIIAKPIIPYIAGYKHNITFTVRPSFIKGLYELTMKLYEERNKDIEQNIPKKFEGRLQKHYVNVVKALNAVYHQELDLVMELAELLVRGEWFGEDQG
jgi:hypothetical protein